MEKLNLQKLIWGERFHRFLVVEVLALVNLLYILILSVEAMKEVSVITKSTSIYELIF